MNDTAYFIQDSDMALVSDTKIRQATYPTAISWLDLADRWADVRGLAELVKAVRDAKFAIFEYAMSKAA